MANDRKLTSPPYFLGWDVFLMGFVPGLLQFRMGDRKRAALALVGCLLVFLAGFAILRDRIFFFALLTPDQGTGSTGSTVLRVLARIGLPTMLPELLNAPGNALASWLALDSGPTAERLWRLPRDFEHVGSWLTAASGMLAAFWSADAHWRLRRLHLPETIQAVAPKANPALCALWTWLLPGLGHLRAGQRDKGLLMGLAVVVVFAAGVVMSQGHAVDRSIYPVWWMGQNLWGGGSLLCAFTTAPLQMTSYPEQLDLGIILCTVAGFMNLVMMVDAYTVAERSGEVAATPAAAGGAA